MRQPLQNSDAERTGDMGLRVREGALSECMSE